MQGHYLRGELRTIRPRCLSLFRHRRDPLSAISRARAGEHHPASTSSEQRGEVHPHDSAVLHRRERRAHGDSGFEITQRLDPRFRFGDGNGRDFRRGRLADRGWKLGSNRTVRRSRPARARNPLARLGQRVVRRTVLYRGRPPGDDAVSNDPRLPDRVL